MGCYPFKGPNANPTHAMKHSHYLPESLAVLVLPLEGGGVDGGVSDQQHRGHGGGAAATITQTGKPSKGKEDIDCVQKVNASGSTVSIEGSGRREAEEDRGAGGVLDTVRKLVSSSNSSSSASSNGGGSGGSGEKPHGDDDDDDDDDGVDDDDDDDDDASSGDNDSDGDGWRPLGRTDKP